MTFQGCSNVIEENLCLTGLSFITVTCISSGGGAEQDWLTITGTFWLGYFTRSFLYFLPVINN